MEEWGHEGIGLWWHETVWSYRLWRREAVEACGGVWQASADEGNMCLYSGQSAGLVDTVMARVLATSAGNSRDDPLSCRHLTASDEVGREVYVCLRQQTNNYHACTHKPLSTVSIGCSCGQIVSCVVLPPESQLLVLSQVVMVWLHWKEVHFRCWQVRLFHW